MPSGPSMESCTTKTVQETGSRDWGFFRQDLMRPVVVMMDADMVIQTRSERLGGW